MGKLQLAGMVGGLGTGLSQGLAQMHGGIIQHGLLEESQKFQTMKQQEQMAHAERLQANTIAATHTEGEATRTQAKELAGQSDQLHRDLAFDANLAKRQDTEATIASHEKISGATIKSHEDISKATLAVNERIANAKMAIDKEQITASEAASLTKTIGDARQEVTRLYIENNKLLQDKDSASAQLIQAELEKTKRTIDGYEATLKSKLGVKTPIAAEAPAFKMPSYGSKKPAGMVTVPRPSLDEQRMMEESIRQ